MTAQRLHHDLLRRHDRVDHQAQRHPVGVDHRDRHGLVPAVARSGQGRAENLPEIEEREEDILDKAFDVRSTSRLGCQARIQGADVVLEVSRESRRATSSAFARTFESGALTQRSTAR